MTLDIVNLKLSAQRALLGHVFADLRAVCVNISENIIQVYFYIDGEISEEQKELCESVVDEIVADFCHIKIKDKDVEFETPFIRLNYPKKQTLCGHWVYYRSEDSSKYK